MVGLLADTKGIFSLWWFGLWNWRVSVGVDCVLGGTVGMQYVGLWTHLWSEFLRVKTRVPGIFQALGWLMFGTSAQSHSVA